MSDGARTRGHKGHNLVLYQLSYAHHVVILYYLKLRNQRSLYSVVYDLSTNIRIPLTQALFCLKEFESLTRRS